MLKSRGSPARTPHRPPRQRRLDRRRPLSPRPGSTRLLGLLVLGVADLPRTASVQSFVRFANPSGGREVPQLLCLLRCASS